MTDSERFEYLLELPDQQMTEALMDELGDLDRKLHGHLDAQIREGLAELARTGELERLH